MKKILIALIIAEVAFIIGKAIFIPSHALLIAVVAFLITLWTNEGLPLGVVSLLPLILLPSLGLGELKSVAVNYANPIIFLFLGGFFIAIAFEKTGLHKVIAQRILSFFPNTPRGMIYSLMITSALLSSILSNTTITLMLMPIALFLTDNKKLKVRFLIATAYGASIGGVLTPIGTPPNLILFGFLDKMGLEALSFIGWIGMVAPVVFTMLLIAPFLLSLGLGKEKITTNGNEKLVFTAEQKKLVWILCALVALLFINSKFGDFYTGLGLSEKLILLGFGLLLFVPGFKFLEWEDTKKVPFEIIFLFGAGFSIAGAFIQSGIASEITQYFLQLSSLPLFLLILVIALFVSFSTEVTSNTAFIAIALPIFFEFAKAAGLDFRLFLMVATVATSYAFMLPIATPPNAIVMSSRVIRIKDMARIGFFINMLGVVVLSAVAYFIW